MAPSSRFSSKPESVLDESGIPVLTLTQPHSVLVPFTAVESSFNKSILPCIDSVLMCWSPCMEDNNQKLLPSRPCPEMTACSNGMPLNQPASYIVVSPETPAIHKTSMGLTIKQTDEARTGQINSNCERDKKIHNKTNWSMGSSLTQCVCSSNNNCTIDKCPKGICSDIEGTVVRCTKPLSAENDLNYDWPAEINVGGKTFLLGPSSVAESVLLSAIIQAKKQGFTKLTGLSSIQQSAVLINELSAPFIDRDPEEFAIFLDYLRTGEIQLPDTEKPPSDTLNNTNTKTSTILKLRRCFHFYGVRYPLTCKNCGFLFDSKRNTEDSCVVHYGSYVLVNSDNKTNIPIYSCCGLPQGSLGCCVSKHIPRCFPALHHPTATEVPHLESSDVIHDSRIGFWQSYYKSDQFVTPALCHPTSETIISSSEYPSNKIDNPSAVFNEDCSSHGVKSQGYGIADTWTDSIGTNSFNESKEAAHHLEFIVGEQEHSKDLSSEDCSRPIWRVDPEENLRLPVAISFRETKSKRLKYLSVLNNKNMHIDNTSGINKFDNCIQGSQLIKKNTDILTSSDGFNHKECIDSMTLFMNNEAAATTIKDYIDETSFLFKNKYFTAMKDKFIPFPRTLSESDIDALKRKRSLSISSSPIFPTSHSTLLDDYNHTLLTFQSSPALSVSESCSSEGLSDSDLAPRAASHCGTFFSQPYDMVCFPHNCPKDETNVELIDLECDIDIESINFDAEHHSDQLYLNPIYSLPSNDKTCTKNKTEKLNDCHLDPNDMDECSYSNISQTIQMEETVHSTDWATNDKNSTYALSPTHSCILSDDHLPGPCWLYVLQKQTSDAQDSTTLRDSRQKRRCEFFYNNQCRRGGKCQFLREVHKTDTSVERSENLPSKLSLVGVRSKTSTSNPKYKTKICPLFRTSGCPRASTDCKFAHGLGELRGTREFFKTQICSFWSAGFCRAGWKCRHAHGSEDLRRATIAEHTQDRVSFAKPDGKDFPFSTKSIIQQHFDQIPPNPVIGNQAIQCNHMQQHDSKTISAFSTLQQRQPFIPIYLSASTETSNPGLPNYNNGEPCINGFSNFIPSIGGGGLPSSNPAVSGHAVGLSSGSINNTYLSGATPALGESAGVDQQEQQQKIQQRKHIFPPPPPPPPPMSGHTGCLNQWLIGTTDSSIAILSGLLDSHGSTSIMSSKR